MIRVKTKQEIATLAEGGKILGNILTKLAAEAKPGATGRQLDQLARELIAEAQAKPSFLGYASKNHPPFPAALCVSINEAVVHGLPNDVALKEGDVVGLDLGLIHYELYLDSARTIIIGQGSAEAQRLVQVTRESLAAGIAMAKIGNTTGDIGATIQEYIEAQGYSVVRQLVGHGVGYAVHEEPPVPNFGKRGRGVKLQEGLVIAIEPMVTTGDPTVTTASDGWTVVIQTGTLSAHEEHTVAITSSGPKILTK